MCEWLRIKKTAFFATLIHILVLAFLIQFGLFINYTTGFNVALVLVYSACGYLLGITQLKKYTKNSQWTYFINRPINEKKVYLALFLAALLGIIIAIIVPYFLVLVVLDYWKLAIIDIRFYLQLIFILGITMSFYILACFTVLIKRKSAHLLLMLVIIPIISINVGGAVYWLLFGVVVYLSLMVISAVKVNINNMSRGFVFQATTAIAYQYAIYFILVSLIFIIHELVLDIEYRTRDIQAEEQLNSMSFREMIFLKPEENVVKGLYTKDQQYADLIEEIKLNKTTQIHQGKVFHPTIQQLPFMDEDQIVIRDREKNVTWKFSHDIMLFIGKNETNKKTIGYLGPNNFFSKIEETRPSDIFLTVPWVQNNQIVVKNKVYQYQSKLQSFELLFAANKDEYLLSDLQNHGSVYVLLTSQNLYIIDSIDFDNDNFPLTAQVKMALPGDYNNLWDIKITEVIDRFVVSFLYGRSFRHDIYNAEQLSYELTLTGQVKTLNQVALKTSPSLMIENLDYMISPIWKLCLDHFPMHPSRDRYLEQRPQVDKLNTNTYLIIMILAVFYASLTLVLAKNRDVIGSKKWVWAMLNTVMGLPGILSFMLLNPKKYQLLNRQLDRGQNHV